MRTIHLDAVGGIAGDMFVAAMLDALPELKPRVLADGAAVLPEEAGRIVLNQGESGGIRALRFRLEAAAGPLAPEHGRIARPVTPNPSPREGGGGGVWQSNSPELLEHPHGETGHLHAHETSRRHEHVAHHHDHQHAASDAGTFRDMVARIGAASLHPGTAGHAAAILTILAEAEAAIHGVPVDEVHFHEIADWDSLADVVCAGSIAAALQGAEWSVSPLPRGSGLVRTAHGLLPVPAPATAAILQGFDWRDDGVAGERVTPTGAAILKHLVSPTPSRASGRLVASGTGAGTRKLPGLPNVLRALVFEPSAPLPSDRVAVIEFEVDDMTGEEIGTAAERLRRANGVLDLSIGQRLGKKGRPMQSFRLLARPGAAEAIAARCFAETSTIGLRLHEQRRLVLAREEATVADVPVKVVERPGGRTVKAQSDALSGNSLAERRARKRRAEDGDD